MRGSISSLILFVSIASMPLHGQSSTWETHPGPNLPSGNTQGSIWTGKRGEVYLWSRSSQPGTDIPQAALYKTSDAGATWNLILSLPDSDAAGLWGVNDTEVFASAKRCPSGYAADCGSGRGVQMFHSLDGGASWAQQVLPAADLKGGDIIRGSLNDVYAAVCPWNADCNYAGGQFLRFDGLNWTAQSADSLQSGLHDLNHRSGFFPEALAYLQPNPIADPTCWGRRLYSSGFEFCDVGRAWGMRDEQGILRLFATGTGNFANGVKIWQFTETSPGSLTGSWGGKAGYVFNDGSADLCGSGVGIWGSSPHDVWVVGQFNPGGPCTAASAGEGRLYHFDGTSWNRVITPSDPLPQFAWDGISGTAADDVWFASRTGQLWHFGIATSPVVRPAPVVNPQGPTLSGTISTLRTAFSTVAVAHEAVKSEAISGNSDAIIVAKALFGQSFGSPVSVAPGMVPFDLDSSTVGFRTLSLPAIAVDGSGRAYMAWAARQTANGDGRVMLSTSPDGNSWSVPQIVETPQPLYDLQDSTEIQPGRGHQLMPAISIVNGTVAVAYYSLYQDSTSGQELCTPGATAPPCASLPQYFDYTLPAGTFLPFPPSPSAAQLATVFTPGIVDATPAATATDPTPAPLLRRHTMDVRVAMANVGASPTFTSAAVSQYAFGSQSSPTMSSTKTIQQLRFNVPNVPLFDNGTEPFMGDYIDLAAQTIVPTVGGSWAYNTSSTLNPFFHAVWTDNRDVRPPTPPATWTQYTPIPLSGYAAGSLGSGCVVGQEGMRNQNIYTSRITGGVTLISPGNSKQLSSTLQRAFSVVAQNNTSQPISYRLSIANQPPGGHASFQQTSLLTTLDFSINPLSSQSRTVFATSNNPGYQITVNVNQITAPGGTLVPNGQQSSVLLNPDPNNPPLISPNVGGAPSVQVVELYVPDLTNPDLTNPDLTNPDLTNPDLTNTGVANPDLTNPDLTNPDLTNTGLTNIAILAPDLTNPDLTNPDLTNPDLTNADISNGSLTDATWNLTNTGNTTASYTIHLITTAVLNPDGTLNQTGSQAGFKTQLILSRLYTTPAAATTTFTRSCQLIQLGQNILVANIPNPTFYAPDLTNPDLTNPDLTNTAPTYPTVTVAPGQTAYVTLRIQAPSKAQAVQFATNLVQPVVIPQAASTGSAAPLVALAIVPVVPPPATNSTLYSLQLQRLGGTGGVTWNVPSGLPPGLMVSSSGIISGTPSANGTFNFTVNVMDSGTPPQTASRTLTIVVAAPSPLMAVNIAPPGGTVGVPYSGYTPAATGGTPPYTWAFFGALPPLLTVAPVTGTISGTPTSSGIGAGYYIVTDSSSPTPQNALLPIFLNVPGFAATGSMTTSRELQTATLLNNGKVLVAGGVGAVGNQVLASAELYDPLAGTFTSTGSMTQARLQHTATLLNNGMVLIVGGEAAGSAQLASAELYDPASGTFRLTGSLSIAVYSHTATLLGNGKVLIAGGFSSSGDTNAAEIYDPATGVFTPTGNMTSVRSSHTATLLNIGQVLIAGGGTSAGLLSTAELYNPATGVFTATGSMAFTRAFHSATLLNGGKVLVVGGAGGPGVNTSAELYNPVAGTFTATGSLSQPHENQTATLLNNGQVLIAGGNSFLPNAGELYDPVAGTFTLAGSMSAPLPNYSATATLLINGQVLIAGGGNVGGGGTETAIVELYTPPTLTPPGLVSIAVTSTTPAVSVATAQQFIATGTFSSGPPQQLASVTWGSGNALAAIANDTTDRGQAFGLAAGAATISATEGSIFGSVAVTVGAQSFNTAPPMIFSRTLHTATLLPNGQVLIAGGNNASSFPGGLSSGELFSLFGGFSLTAGNMTTARYAHTATLLQNGTVLITGGLTADFSTALNTAEIYNPATGMFTPVGNLNVARGMHTATLLSDGTVLIAGGGTFSGGTESGTATAEIYDPVAQTFTPVAAGMADPHIFGTATLLGNGTVLIAGGDPFAPVTTAEIYNPSSHTFTTVGPMGNARAIHTATLLSNGKVLLAGGVTAGGSGTQTAELYDPSAGFSATGNLLNGARYNHAATLLLDGTVLIAGGFNGQFNGACVGCTDYSDGQVYNPATGTFTVTSNSMISYHYSHTATLLDNGTVLVAGGGASGAALAVAEIY